MQYRLWREADLPGLKDLWTLAFGDGGDYVDNFFQQFSGLVYVAEDGGVLLAMTAVFDTQLHRHGEPYKMGYLYAVATHPQHEKKGIASGLLAFLYGDLGERGYAGVTTVPATPSLHHFFGKNGFLEYFDYGVLPLTGTFSGMEEISPKEYGIRRGEILEQAFGTGEMAYISLQEEGYAYQASICALGCGGLFWDGKTLLAVEQSSGGEVVVKECLGTEDCFGDYQACTVTEGRGLPGTGKTVAFGMIQWLGATPQDWTDTERGYLGFAFD